MNRQIKFRAWDGFNAVWYKSGSSYQELQHFFETLAKCEAGGNPIHLCQFIGIIDKNGKEIFEGDIVNFKPIDKADRMNRVVRYSDDFACFFFDSKDHWFGKPSPSQIKCHFPDDNHEYEVIGNIFENPELVEEK